MGCLIIAEAGVNHNNDLEMAFDLCLAAKKAGADVVKFQTWLTESVIVKSLRQADYQVKNTEKDISQYEMLKTLEMSYENFVKIKKYCDEIGITFASTADEVRSLDFLVNLGIPFIKVGSGDIGNVPFLRYIGGKKLPIIMSTGMSTFEDIDISLAAVREGGDNNITLLHCTTNYPCSYEEVNLKAMVAMKEKYNIPVGYSDHTLSEEVAVAAVAMGAEVIEKHLTLDKNLRGPDHTASMEPEKFRHMVKMIRKVEIAMGSNKKAPTESEKEIAKVVTKRIVAACELPVGTVFTEKNICIKRSDTGLPAREWDRVVGQIAKKKYFVDEGIE